MIGLVAFVTAVCIVFIVLEIRLSNRRIAALEKHTCASPAATNRIEDIDAAAELLRGRDG